MRKVLHLMGVLHDSDVDWMTANGSVQTLPPSHVLIHEGQHVDSIYVLLEGALSVRIAGAGRPVEVARLLTGEVVGEISMVDSRPPSADVVTLCDSQVLAIPKNRLYAKLEADNAFAAHFYKAIASFLADRMRKTTSQLGYGNSATDRLLPDEIDDTMMDGVALGAARFDKMLRRLRLN